MAKVAWCCRMGIKVGCLGFRVAPPGSGFRRNWLLCLAAPGRLAWSLGRTQLRRRSVGFHCKFRLIEEDEDHENLCWRLASERAARRGLVPRIRRCFGDCDCETRPCSSDRWKRFRRPGDRQRRTGMACGQRGESQREDHQLLP